MQENLEKVTNNIERSLDKVGRKDNVDLIAVTKTLDNEIVETALNLGITDIGENRDQEIIKRFHHFHNSLNYHMIGHLQTNKVRNIIDKVKLVHSLDRPSLSKELDKRAKMNNLIVDVLIQVNVAEEKSKFGLKVEEVLPFIEETLVLENIRIKGLMTMAPYVADESVLRHIFSTMYNLKEEILKRNYKELDMKYLSMGMTNDYEIAIEEGSNMVRVGTGIFGRRNY